MMSRPWGGSEGLTNEYGCDPNKQIGEVWVLSGLPDQETPLRWCDSTQSSLPSQSIEALTGTQFPRFPIMIKVIEAKEWLSVQVHPNDPFARERESEPWGKSEFWVVLRAHPEGQIITGLQQYSSLPSFLDFHSSEENPTDPFMYTPVQEGDGIYIPAKTVHALGPNVRILEIQQTSELTYRIHDWGRDREIHWGKAKTLLEKGCQPAQLIPKIESFHCPNFSIFRRKEGVVEGFCSVFALQPITIDHWSLPRYQLAVIPFKQRHWIQGDHIQIRLDSHGYCAG